MAKSSRAWLHRHINDAYVQRAVKEGYRSRAAYKLQEIDRRDRLLRPGMTVVDLGCAPGGWTQIAVERTGRTGIVVGIDLLPIDPVDPAVIIQGDFMADEGLAAVRAALAGRPADLVLSDMSPNLSGLKLRDQARHYELAEAADAFAVEVLKPDGAFLIKCFHGVGFQEYVAHLRRQFVSVASRKPDASRSESTEVYLLARTPRSSPAQPSDD